MYGRRSKWRNGRERGGNKGKTRCMRVCGREGRWNRNLGNRRLRDRNLMMIGGGNGRGRGDESNDGCWMRRYWGLISEMTFCEVCVVFGVVL